MVCLPLLRCLASLTMVTMAKTNRKQKIVANGIIF
jgi:hypothetical protein